MEYQQKCDMLQWRERDIWWIHEISVQVVLMEFSDQLDMVVVEKERGFQMPSQFGTWMTGCVLSGY